MIKIFIIPILILLFAANLLAQPAKKSLEISHLVGDFYVFTTYQAFKGIVFPSNGMYLLTAEGAVIFDTPWDKNQCQPLLDSIKTKHNQSVIMCIATHAHEDRTGGFEFYQKKDIKTFTTKQTDDISKERNEPRAEFLIEKDTTFLVGNRSFRTYYAGQGHTSDNIVIWFGKEKILYGGCLIKSVEAKDLGNLADANVKAWKSTIKKLQQTFKQPTYIITGHQSWTSRESLAHTLKLIKQHKAK